jgi:hypothetical protein
MNEPECLRILGLPADATPEQIRQAYLDLVRVWHPDRFQSDSRLQSVAQERLCVINEAYSQLKNRRTGDGAQASNRADEPKAETNFARPSQATNARQEAHPRDQAKWATPPHSRRYIQGDVARAAVAVILCGIPIFGATKLLQLMRVPALDGNLIAARTVKPEILNPMRIIDPSSDVRLASDMLTEWARGDVIDLWRPHKPAASQITTPTVPGNASQAVSGNRENRAKRANSAAEVRHTTAKSKFAPRSGTELIAAIRYPAPGYLHVTNQTNLEAIAKVVSNHTTVRAVYIRPHENVVIRSIRIGMYELHVDLGTDLDMEHLSFRKDQSIAEPLGPFEFHEITSENGVSGSHYNIALNSR